MSESESKSPLLGVLVVLGIAILLAVTNPSVETHRDAIAREFEQEHPLAGAVGLGALGAQLSEYHSAVLGSYTTVGDEVRSIGALGMVWVVDIETD
jgi:hypothetical protein